MSHSEPARIAARRIRSAILTALVVVSTTTLSPPTALGETDGAVPEGVRVFDDDIPAVANLDPGLRRALRQAAMDAAKDGIEIVVNSGWRSREYQKQLLRDAVAKYRLRKGSRPMGSHSRHVFSCVGGRGRHRALPRHGVAVQTRRRVRAMPDLQERALALRTAPRSHR